MIPTYNARANAVDGLAGLGFLVAGAVHGWEFRHLDEIAFDYRVHDGSMIGTTNLHFNELMIYIFNKPENRAVRWSGTSRWNFKNSTGLYEQIKQSKDYRLGRWPVDPVTRLKNHCARQKHRELLAVKPSKH